MAVASCAVLLAGCAGVSAPPSDAPPVAVPALRPAVLPAEAFERRQREAAALAEEQGRLADAALAWELLALLRPEVEEYRTRLEAMRRRIEAEAEQRLQRAAQARQRGDLDAAAAQYLAALAVKPDDLRAAEALRGIERERNRRLYLGRYSRYTITRRANLEAEMINARTARDPQAGTRTTIADGSVVGSAPDAVGRPLRAARPERLGHPKRSQREAHAAVSGRNELEHASMLMAQGQIADAQAMLEASVAADPHDAASRLMLAEVYYQHGERLAMHDRAAAIAALEKSVKADATHPRAQARLKQLRASRVAGEGALDDPR
ncbi:tetratricopeptide repeat protein [Azohydromonas aeria]|uniref:tetratricopeptide repeat protein n=1 Tax=Azohydromonas aeria TaxID=2590212 RepID=UPI0012F97D3B|nr:tetratricopeptide repeat protein [Azohydromonas aeria]